MSTFEPIAILRTLDDFGVRYVVIGGAAAVAHGSPSVTRDVDICYDRAADNLERLAAALGQMHAKLRGVDDEVPFLLDAKTLEKGDCFTFTTDLGPLDILGTPAGSRGYDELSRTADDVVIGDISVRIASIGDLILMKQAAGRPKDRVEVEILGALRDEIEGRQT